MSRFSLLMEVRKPSLLVMIISLALPYFMSKKTVSTTFNSQP